MRLLYCLKFSASIVVSAMLISAHSAAAQGASLNTAAEEEIVLDTVDVIGAETDPAMAAFRAGDYATAEVEFLDNARCALRRERNLLASFENARLEADRAETLSNAGTVDSGASTRGQSAGAGQSAQTGVATRSSVSARNAQTEVDRNCEKRGRQMYFAGLSQLQLGKTDDALRSFQTATSESRILYDAHYKIGLINLMNGDAKTAGSELRSIERILERCRQCEAKSEIVARRDHLRKAIMGEVSLQ